MARNPLTPFRSGSLLGGDPFLSLHREMNRLFDDVLRGSGAPLPSQGQGQGGASLLMPHMDVTETEKDIRVTAELPGVTENDIEVTLEDDVLTIRGEKRFERQEEKENVHFTERSFGTFQRAVRLPFPADPEQVQARFENGVLTVTLPKTQAQERTRRIQVQSGKQAGGQAGDSQRAQGETGKGSTAGGRSPGGGST